MINFDYSLYCIKRLFEVIPEIEEVEGGLREELEYVKRGIIEGYAGAHTLYEDVFCRYIFYLINKNIITEREKDIIDRSFKLIEELANHEEVRVRNVADVSFIESILDKIKPMKRIEDYLLPRSLEMARGIAYNQFGYDPTTWEEMDEWWKDRGM